MNVFEYNIEIKGDRNISSKYEIGNFWAVVEEFVLPESLVSDKGAFLFKLKEDNKTLKDIWILAIPHTKDILSLFLRKKLNYGEFLEKSKLFIAYWDLNVNEIYLQKPVDLLDLKKLNKRIEDILGLTIIPSNTSNLEKVLNFIEKYVKYVPSKDKIESIPINEIVKYYNTILKPCMYQESSKIKMENDSHRSLLSNTDFLTLAA